MWLHCDMQIQIPHCLDLLHNFDTKKRTEMVHFFAIAFEKGTALRN